MKERFTGYTIINNPWDEMHDVKQDRKNVNREYFEAYAGFVEVMQLVKDNISVQVYDNKNECIVFEYDYPFINVDIDFLAKLPKCIAEEIPLLIDVKTIRFSES